MSTTIKTKLAIASMGLGIFLSATGISQAGYIVPAGSKADYYGVKNPHGNGAAVALYSSPTRCRSDRGIGVAASGAKCVKLGTVCEKSLYMREDSKKDYLRYLKRNGGQKSPIYKRRGGLFCTIR